MILELDDFDLIQIYNKISAYKKIINDISPKDKIPIGEKLIIKEARAKLNLAREEFSILIEKSVVDLK
tara:strand:- start:444 stop:647 length:204 start_codon:yes stop_codon:yes gene_type:complete